MSIYYTYLVKCVPTGEYYYGVRYSIDSNPSELWKTYFTSSNLVKARIEEYGKDSFIYEIRKLFTNSSDARIWEHKVISKMNMINRPDFMNKSNGILFSSRSNRKNHIMVQIIESGKYKFVTIDKAMGLIDEGKAIRKGKPKSQETKDAISKSHKGKKKTKEHINKIATSQRGIRRKTWEEQYGKEAAEKRKNIASKKFTGATTSLKGKTYEEILGKEKASKIKKLRSNQLTENNPSKNMKGKTYNELYGKREADRLRKIRSKTGLSNRKSYKMYHNNFLVYQGNREGISSICLSITGKKLSNILYDTAMQEKYKITIVKV